VSNPETILQTAIRQALGLERDLTMWRNNVGQVRTGHGSYVRYGLAVGSSDLIGILAPLGKFVALEVKTPNGRLDQEQRLYLELVRSRGGFATVVRSVADARAAIERARGGSSE